MTNFTKILLSLFVISILTFQTANANEIIDSVNTTEHVHGSIQNGVYSWGIADTKKTFLVKIPQYKDKNSYATLQVKEQRNANMTYVSFGPSEIDKNIYRVIFTKKPKGPFLVKKLLIEMSNYILGTLKSNHHAKVKPLFAEMGKFSNGHDVGVILSLLTTKQDRFMNIEQLEEGSNFLIAYSGDLYLKNNEKVEVVKNNIIQAKNVKWENFVRSTHINK